jgi:hypothetical protein
VSGTNEATLLRLVDRAEIQDTIYRYARGVDRNDKDLIRSAYHPDAYDDHVDYKGDIEGFLAWIDHRFAAFDNSMHFLGNCLIEFAGPDIAFVETYFASRRTRAPVGEEAANLKPDDAICRQSWGRYLDRFERRKGEWRVARRIVVIDARFSSVAIGGARAGSATWGTRETSDPLWRMRAEVLGAHRT